MEGEDEIQSEPVWLLGGGRVLVLAAMEHEQRPLVLLYVPTVEILKTAETKLANVNVSASKHKIVTYPTSRQTDSWPALIHSRTAGPT